MPESRPAFNWIALTSVALTVTILLVWSHQSPVAMSAPQENSAAETESPAAAATKPCQGWPQPQFALFVSGRQHGYIEPCGCTGLDQAKGGLSRRHAVLRDLRQRGWDVVPIDVGNQVRRTGPQAAIKFQTTSALLQMMGYKAISFGPDDLKISTTELLVGMGDVEGNTAFVSANVDVFELNPKFVVTEAGGKRIGITAVVGKDVAQQVSSEDIQIADMTEALKPVVDELQGANCDHLVLLAHCTLAETEALATQFPVFDIVVTAGGAGEPTLEPATLAGSSAKIVQAGTKGIYVGVLGFYDNEVRYERIELDNRFPDSAEVLDAFAIYQQQLRDQGLSGLGLRPVRHPRSTEQSPREFVGHEACGECHTTAYEIFLDTPHFHSTQSIAEPTERSSIKRHHDPECLSCHVTGWNPQGYFPYVSGYLDLKESVALHTNGCENCHGPGSAHVAAENDEADIADEEKEKLREEMRLTLEEARQSKCYDCHDTDNSPDFEFDSYWAEVEHYGKD